MKVDRRGQMAGGLTIHNRHFSRTVLLLLEIHDLFREIRLHVVVLEESRVTTVHDLGRHRRVRANVGQQQTRPEERLFAVKVYNIVRMKGQQLQ